MTCRRCLDAAAEGYNYCPVCGDPLNECPVCKEYSLQGYSYCGKCGRPLKAEKKSYALEKAVFILIPIIAAFLIADLICMYLGAADTFGWIPGHSINLYVVFFEVFKFTVSGTALQAYWILLVIAVTLCLAATAYHSREVLDRRSPDYINRMSRTPAYYLALTFGAYLVISAVLILIMQAAGAEITSPDLPSGRDPESLLLYTGAAVWEEIAFHLFMLGLPVALVALIRGRKNFPRFLLGGFGFSVPVLILMILSSVYFGIAHTDSWGSWKIIPATIAGLMMSYLYVRFGIHVSVTFHFLIDYMTISHSLMGDALFNFLFIFAIVIGFVCLADLLKRLYEGLGNLKDLPSSLDYENIFSRRD